MQLVSDLMHSIARATCGRKQNTLWLAQSPSRAATPTKWVFFFFSLNCLSSAEDVYTVPDPPSKFALPMVSDVPPHGREVGRFTDMESTGRAQEHPEGTCKWSVSQSIRASGLSLSKISRV